MNKTVLITGILSRPVQMQKVPRNSWEELFRSQGMKNPLPRIQMLDDFNEGWIEFESGEAGSQRGSTSLDSVLKRLIQTSSE
jgi:NAD(P)H dehydrogenase (quinone)